MISKTDTNMSMQFAGILKVQTVPAKCKASMTRMGVLTIENHVSITHKVSDHHLRYK
jgi:hypothetical protein